MVGRVTQTRPRTMPTGRVCFADRAPTSKRRRDRALTSQTYIGSAPHAPGFTDLAKSVSSLERHGILRCCTRGSPNARHWSSVLVAVTVVQALPDGPRHHTTSLRLSRRA